VRIRRIRLASYRGTTEREVHFDPGVTVIEGPNEAGKSSLAEALDLVFDFLDSSQHKAVRDVIPVDRDASPEIEVEIETGPWVFSYRKRFGRGASTELRIERPRPESLSGRAAHDRAREILAETIDVELWRALRIQQGLGVAQAELGGRQALIQALDAASGGAAAGDEDPALFERVEAEVQLYFTPTGRERGEHAECGKRVARAREQVAALEAKERALARDVEESARLAARLRKLDEEQPACDAELARRSAEAARVGALRGELAASDAQRDRARAAEQAAAQAHAEREAQAARLAAFAAQLLELEARAKTACGALGELGVRLDAAERRVVESRAAEAAAENAAALAQQDVDFRRTELEADQFRERLDRVREEQRRALEAEQVLATNGLTREVLREVQQADSALRQARARLEEGGPRVWLRALSTVELEIDGAAISLAAGQEATVPAPRPTRVRLPGQLDVEVRPGTSLDELDAAMRGAERAWAELAARWGVDSLDGATRAHVAREAAARVRETASERIRDALRDLSPEALEAKWIRARDARESYHAGRVAEPPLPATLDEAKAALARALALRSEAAGSRAAAEAALDETRRAHAAQREDQASLDGRLGQARGTLAVLEEQLEAARLEHPDDSLAAALAGARERLAAAEAAAGRLAQRLAELGPEQVDARLRGATAALEQVQRERQENEVARAAVAARLELQQEDGLFEALEQARAHLVQTERAAAALARRAGAARLLHETLARHRDEARRRYVDPLRARIRELGRVVFGSGFDVTLGEDLAIENRTLDGVTVAFDQLSTGTREQLGFLARLAAAMIVAPHEGVPLLLDDALGYTDPDRIRALNAALGVAGERCQVVILTCWPERFRGVPGARIERLSAGAPRAS
jgi:hypothetical protein